MSLPFGYYCLAAFCLISVVLLLRLMILHLTLASVATQRLRAEILPGGRGCLGRRIGRVAISLMYIDGGQKIILSAIVFSLPLLAVGIMWVYH